MHLGYGNVGANYLMNGINMISCEEYKDLGLRFSKDLDCTKYIKEIALKASRICYMVSKGFRECGVERQALAFKTFIKPLLEYNSQVWSPSKVADIKNIEKVQRKFTKYLEGFNGMSYKERLDKLEWRSLEWRRMENDLKLAFKIVNGMIYGEEEGELLRRSVNRTNYVGTRVETFTVRNNTRFNFFTNRVGRLWNKLPAELTLCKKKERFNKILKNYDLGRYLRVHDY